MNKFEIVYDLNSLGQNYPAVEKAIKEASAAVLKIQRTTWLVKTQWTATQVRDHIRQAMDSNDQLMVTGLTSVAAWSGYTSDGDQMIKNFLEAA